MGHLELPLLIELTAGSHLLTVLIMVTYLSIVIPIHIGIRRNQHFINVHDEIELVVGRVNQSIVQPEGEVGGHGVGLSLIDK